MVSTIESPMLTGLREQARRMIEAQDVPLNLSGTDVILDGHRTRAATPSFADEVIKTLVVERGAKSLTIRVAGREFTEWLLAAAERYEVVDRVVANDSVDA